MKGGRGEGRRGRKGGRKESKEGRKKGKKRKEKEKKRKENCQEREKERDYQIGLQSSYAIMHSHQQLLRVPLGLHACQCLLWSVLLILAIPVVCLASCGLCFHFLMVNGMSKHFFICLVIYHLYILFDEVSVQKFLPIFNLVVLMKF